MIDAIVAAVMMGLLSSFHCALMCGPLAVAGSRSRSDAAGYFGGRAIAYACAGAVFGSLGHAVPLGPAWSWLVAAWMMIHGIALLRPTQSDLVQLRRRPAISFLARLLPRRGLGLGIATGILPCGMLASAWMLAASTHHPLTGAIAMFAFALASTPSLALMLAGRRLLYGVQVPRTVHAALWCGLSVFVALRPWIAGDGGCHT